MKPLYYSLLIMKTSVRFINLMGDFGFSLVTSEFDRVKK